MAAVVGTARERPAAENDADRRPFVEVCRRDADLGAPRDPSRLRAGGSLLPVVGDEVFARVVRVNPRLANVEILSVGGVAVEDAFSGVIRAQDVRATEVDKVDIYDCFVPSDVVRARVLSLGDSRSYYLTTAENPSTASSGPGPPSRGGHDPGVLGGDGVPLHEAATASGKSPRWSSDS